MRRKKNGVWCVACCFSYTLGKSDSPSGETSGETSLRLILTGLIFQMVSAVCSPQCLCCPKQGCSAFRKLEGARTFGTQQVIGGFRLPIPHSAPWFCWPHAWCSSHVRLITEVSCGILSNTLELYLEWGILKTCPA